MKAWLQDNNIIIDSAHNERKYTVPGRFIRTLNNNWYKCATSVSRNMYIGTKMMWYNIH